MGTGNTISEQTFWQKTKRFFEPIKYRKLEYSKEIFKALLLSTNIVIHVLFLERVVSYLESGNSDTFFFVLKIYGIYILAFEILHFSIKKWGWMNTLPYTDSAIMERYLSQYIRMNNNHIELIGTGKLIGLIKEGVFVWVEMISDMIEQLSSISITLLFATFMVWRFNPDYVWIFILFLILFFIVAIWCNKKLILFRSQRYEVRNERLRHFVKIMMSKIEILQNGKIQSETNFLYKNSEKITDISRKMAFHRAIMKRVSPFILSLIILGTFIVLGEKTFNGSLNISLIVGLSATFIIMQKAIADALTYYVKVTKRFVALEKLWEFIDTTPQIQGYDEGDTFVHKNGAIQLQNINYGYDETKRVFEDFSLEIPGNRVTALVGPSGGGKSTLVKLISGYIRQDSGDILVDSQNLRDVSLRSYYQDIGYLTQEPSVFDGSVRENLLYAVSEDIPEDRIKEIISLTHADFIYNLPNGLDTEIGERGVKLSGGQKQRLAIAKIFLKNPKIIILDEPTSALDSLSEKKITEAMHNLFKSRTVLVIAHRLQTVKHADDIIVIEGGKIIERGKHNELTKKNGFYKEMLDLQSGF